MILQNIHELFRTEPNRIFRILHFVFFTIYSWPLIFKLPHTLKRIYEAFRPGGTGIPDKDFWAFSRTDAEFRTWYSKIAHDYKTQGRFGYVWDDGLGMRLGTRIYNNSATYWLLDRLGNRHMMGLGFVIMLLFCGLLIGWAFNPWLGAIIAIIAAGSPLLVGTYTHVSNPEIFWWGLAGLVVFCMLSGNALLAGLLWSVLAWVNLPISVMLVLLTGPALLFLLPFSGLLLLVLGALPGAIKHGLRGLYMWRTGFMSTLTGEQARLRTRPLYPIPRELIWWLPFILSIAASAYAMKQPLVGGLLVLAGVGLYWANFRFVKLNDARSFYLAYWVIGLCFAALAHSIPALLAILVLAYVSPRFCDFPVEIGTISQDKAPWQQRMQVIQERMQEYPMLTPTIMPQPPTVMAFFDTIPNGARLLFEADGDPRTDSKFRAFLVWTEEFLPPRQIDIANEMYTRLVEPELVDQYLSRFNAEQMTSEKMEYLCRVLGVSYVVAFSASTIKALESVGFEAIAQVDLAELTEFHRLIRTPLLTLTLLKNPHDVTVIEPVVAWERRGNELVWEVKAGESYVVRYRYDEQFRGHQNGHTLDIQPYTPVEGISLRFMQVRAATNGQLILKFHPRWI
jgi:hypothetical protein